jgi:signal transduction histidine kinase
VKLRARAALTLFVGLVPLVVLLVWGFGVSRERALTEAMVDALAEALGAEDGAACAADPEAFVARVRGERDRRRGFRRAASPHGAGVAIAFYDAQFRPGTAGGPRLDAAMIDALRHGATSTVRREEGRRGARLVVAMPTPWGRGRCAFVVAARPDPRRGRPLLWASALGIALVAVAIGGLAVGPIVRRIRALTAAVAAEAPLPEGGHDEIGALARAFVARREELRRRLAELEARDAALQRFVANTTHDVMLPLTVLHGHLAALEESARDGNAQMSATIRAAQEEAHYLASLVQNLGVAAKLDAGAPHVVLHDVALVPLVERVVARHARLAAQRGLELAHAVPAEGVTVRGDVTLLEQAVSNLVHNAVRYAEPGGHVAVVLEHTGPARFELRVLDDGPGVSEALLARLGERGFRTDEARTRQPQGTGLGLHIVRDVAARLGLTLRFARGEGRGLVVTLSGACHVVPDAD